MLVSLPLLFLVILPILLNSTIKSTIHSRIKACTICIGQAKRIKRNHKTQDARIYCAREKLNNLCRDMLLLTHTLSTDSIIADTHPPSILILILVSMHESTMHETVVSHARIYNACA